jgi:hypothetical protein
MTKWPKEKGQTVKPWSVSNTTQKAKDWATRIPQKTRLMVGYVVPAPLLTLIVLLLLQIWWQSWMRKVQVYDYDNQNISVDIFQSAQFHSRYNRQHVLRYLLRYWPSAPQFSDVRVKTMYDSPWLPFVWYEIHVLSMVFLFIYVYWCLTRFPYQMTSCRFTVTRRVSNVEQELITFP